MDQENSECKRYVLNSKSKRILKKLRLRRVEFFVLDVSGWSDSATKIARWNLG